MRKLLVCLAALSLVFSLATAPAYAQGKKGGKEKAGAAAKPAKAGKAQKVAGTVSSVSDTSLAVKTATGQDTFVINPQTKKEGTIENGGKVTVHYKMEGNDKVATVVKAAKAKPPKAAKESKKKKKA